MLTDVPGIRVGHWSEPDAGTGCTVVLCPPGTVGGADVRGGGPGTRETDLLSPMASTAEVTALLLTGGSAIGLGAASGVVRFCEEQGMGLEVGPFRVPIVPGAVIFDLGVSGNARRPEAEDAYAACQAAGEGRHEVGSVGAGTGATVGKLLGREGWCKGGLGAASVTTHDGVTVAALAVVNAFGDVIDERGEVLAGAWSPELGFVRAWERAITHPPTHPRLAAPANTTLACVATDGRLTKVEVAGVARMAGAGMCRAIAPVNTMLDGDVSFALATGARPASAFAVGTAAAELVARAVRDGVRSAQALRGVPTADDRRAAGA